MAFAAGCARDIMPSDDWAEAILKAITSSKLMVLIFSHNTTQSPHVRREIERAVHHGVPIAPLRVEDVLPDGALEYFLRRSIGRISFPGRFRNMCAMRRAEFANSSA